MTARDSPDQVDPAPITRATAAAPAEHRFDARMEARPAPRPADRPRRARLRRRELALLVLLGCVGLFLLVRWLALQPFLDGTWRVEGDDGVVLVSSPLPQLQALNGTHLERISAGEGQTVDVDASLLQRSQQLAMHYQHPGANPELVLAYRLPRMLKVALCVTMGALNRTESRGAHFREDFTARDDQAWLKRTLATWPEGASQPSLSYEALDVNGMELPPGFRGYGVKNIIEHPQSAARQAEVDALRQAEPDRHARQNALMPFAQLLPPKYRGSNERLAG